MATLSREQAAALLEHRCELIRFEGEIDAGALRAGAPAACLPILRYVFVGFSEALDDFFRNVGGHTFHEGMSDEQLVTGIMCVWDLISPHAPLGAATVDKVLHPEAWGADRLLFTLQCVLLCCRKHRALVAQSEEAWLASGLSWTSTSPQQQFGPDHRPLVGTECGAGTTGLCFREGVPQVVVPVAFDQSAWAARVTSAGVGVACPSLLEALVNEDGAPGNEAASRALLDAVRAAMVQTRSRLADGGGSCAGSPPHCDPGTAASVISSLHF